MSKSDIAPVIRRKKIIKADGHHGGAWKIAYADFVTAMMAFFLLMWLLSTTSEEMREGIADYFTPDLAVKHDASGTAGQFQGDSFTADGAASEAPSAPPDGRDAAESDADTAEQVETLAEALEAAFAEGAINADLTQHLAIRVSDEGVIISLFDTQDATLFGNGSAAPNEKMKELLAVVSKMLLKFKNAVAITGHTSSLRFATPGYSNWDLSIDRAQAIRQFLSDHDLPAGRLSRVTGKADREPAVADPDAAENRRIDITLLIDADNSAGR